MITGTARLLAHHINALTVPARVVLLASNLDQTIRLLEGLDRAAGGGGRGGRGGAPGGCIQTTRAASAVTCMPMASKASFNSRLTLWKPRIAASAGTPLSRGPRRLTVFLTAAATALVGIAVVQQQPAHAAWNLVWADEFNGSGAPSSANWNFNVGNGLNPGLNAFDGWGNGEWEWYRPENCTQSGGNLVMRANWLTTPIVVNGRNSPSPSTARTARKSARPSPASG